MKARMLFIAGMLFFHGLSAQRMCGTSQYVKTLPASLTGSSAKMSGPARDTVPNEIFVIPVIVHVLYNSSQQNISDAQILSQLKVLNEDFRRMNADSFKTPGNFKSLAADGGITFCLAQVDPAGRTTRGIVKKHTTKEFYAVNDEMKFSASGGDNAWDAKKYLNIWVCNMLGRNLGYASLPGSEPDKDGVVINYDVFGTTGIVRSPFNKGRTTTHEVGHWLGLKHIWGDSNCGSDDVDDTPTQQSYNFYCPSFPSRSICSPNINGDMFMNFMDFTDDACMNMFTRGQKNKMRSLFAVNNARNSFLNSFACDSSLAVGGPLPDSILVEKQALAVIVYPNPATDKVRFMVNDGYSLSGWKLVIRNSSGSIISPQLLHSNHDFVIINQLANGIYFLTLENDETRLNVKLLKTD